MAIKTLMKRLRARLRSAVSPRGTDSTRPILTSAVSAVVDFCLRRSRWTLASATARAAASGIYAAERFAIKTDINELISPHLPWAKRALQYMREFPQFGIIAAIDAPTPELAERAATDLTRALLTHPERFRAVSHPGSGKSFETGCCLCQPTKSRASPIERVRPMALSPLWWRIRACEEFSPSWPWF